MFLKSGTEKMVIIKNQPESAENHNVGIGLKTDTRQQLVIGLAGHREDRDLLAFNQTVKKIDHGNFGLDHFSGHYPHHGIDGGACNLYFGIRGQIGTVIKRFPGPPKNSSQNVIRVGHILRMAEKTHTGIG